MILQELPAEWDLCYLFVHPNQASKNIVAIPSLQYINRAVYTYGLGMHACMHCDTYV